MRKILEWDDNPQTNKQTNKNSNSVNSYLDFTAPEIILLVKEFNVLNFLVFDV